MSDTIIDLVVEQLRTMPTSLHQEVLLFTRKLQAPAQVGVPGKSLLRFAGSIPLDDLEIMRQALEIEA